MFSHPKLNRIGYQHDDADHDPVADEFVRDDRLDEQREQGERPQLRERDDEQLLRSTASNS